MRDIIQLQPAAKPEKEVLVLGTQIQMSLLPGIPEIELSNTGSKEDGMRRVASNMNPEWGEFAFRCVSEVAAEMASFTSDDVDAKIQACTMPNRPVTHDKRAMGPVMSRAAKNGLISPTDRILKSNRAKLHGSPRRIWQSLILANEPGDTLCAA